MQHYIDPQHPMPDQSKSEIAACRDKHRQDYDVLRISDQDIAPMKTPK